MEGTIMPRFCTHCGKLLKDGERFCTNCGTPVTDDGQASQSQEDAQAAEYAAASDAAFDTAATTVQSAQQPTATQPQQADVTMWSAHQPAPAPQPEVGATQQWATPAGSAPQQPIPTAAPQAGTPRCPQEQQCAAHRHYRRTRCRDYRAGRILYDQAFRQGRR